MDKESSKRNYELKRQRKMEEKGRLDRQRPIKQIVKITGVVIILGGIVGLVVWLIASQPSIPEGDIISRDGIHYHPELTILIKGQKQEVPDNVGIGVTHAPIHTHDASGTLHLEIPGFVTKDDTRLERFFKIWGKQFNSNCIFESCNGTGGTVKMLVNGQENKEFEAYPMKDGDKIEIRYE